MKRLLLGVIAVAGVISTIIFWPKTATSASDGTGGEINIDDTEDADIGVLVAALKKAEKEINDPDLKDYYHALIEKYDLESTPSGSIIDLGADALPDIDSIVRTAIEFPLQEAGKTITDPDIKAFYYDFLKDSGFDIGEESTGK